MSSTAPLGWVDVTLREIIAPPIGSGATTDQIVEVAREVAACGALCIEALDPLSAQRTLERWGESPWDRLRAVVRMAGRTSVGIYIAGRTLMGDRPLGADILRRAVLGAAESGATRVRAFDPLNHADAMEAVAEAAREAGIRFVPTLHVGPAPDGDHGLWIDEARALAGLPGVDAIAVADGGGHLSPIALASLVRAVIAATGLPVEVAVVACGGVATPAAVAAIEAGASAIHAAVGTAALVSGRPSVETLRAALADGPRTLQLDRVAIGRAAQAVLPAFSGEVLRQAAAAANGPALGLNPRLASGLGGRLSRLGVGDRLPEAADETAAVARDCGGLIVMHPFGEAIVAQAAEHVASGTRWEQIDEVLADALVGRWGELRGPVLPAAAERASAASHTHVDAVTDLAAVRAEAPADLAEEDLILWAQFPESTEQLLARRMSIGGEQGHSHHPDYRLSQ